MSLQTRLADLVAAIAADIKTLFTAVNAQPKITVSATPPADPEEGDIWIDIS